MGSSTTGGRADGDDVPHPGGSRRLLSAQATSGCAPWSCRASDAGRAWRRRVAAVNRFGLACAALLAVPLAAEAAPPELFSQLALHPTDPNRIVLAYVQGGQGLLFSEDGGQTFSLRCGAAVSSSFTRSRVPLLVTGDGETLLGTFEGLVRGGSDGCGFGDDADLRGLQVADFVPHPTDPEVAFVATANSTDGRATGLVRRNADGSFTALTPPSDAGVAGSASVSMNRLGVTVRPDGGLRFYASALETDDADDYRPTIRHSDDAGASWVSYDVANAAGSRVLLIGVDPTHTDRIAIVLQREQAPDSVLVSTDAGRSFEQRLEIFDLGASSVAPDGRLWVGDAGGDVEYSQPGGLYRLDDFTAAAQKLATYPVRCLGYRALDGALFGCKRSEFGGVDPESGEFHPRTSFAQIGGFVSCGDEALAAACKPQLCDNWCGVLHYASAPLCDAYDELNPLCGPAARSYGQADPMAAAGGTGPALPGAEPVNEPARDPGTPESTASVAPARNDAACRIGSTPATPAALAFAALFPGLALWLRRRPKREARRAPTRRAFFRAASDACNPRLDRNH
jgi:hypothetical protein